jgi:hypothetical protein
MAGIVLDAGGLIALDRNNHRAACSGRRDEQSSDDPVVSFGPSDSATGPASSPFTPDTSTDKRRGPVGSRRRRKRWEIAGGEWHI